MGEKTDPSPKKGPATSGRAGGFGPPPFSVALAIGIHTAAGRGRQHRVAGPDQLHPRRRHGERRPAAMGKSLDRGETATILVSGATARQLGPNFTLEPSGSFQLAGRQEAVEVYHLLT